MSDRPYIKMENSNNSKDRNRALDIRRDTDDFTFPSITLYDVDYALLYEMTNGMVPPLLENGNLITVPIRYANGDTSAQIQRFGYINGIDDKVITPIITIQRTGMGKNTDVPMHNLPNDIFEGPIIIPKIQNNNQYDRIDQTYDSKDSVEYYMVRNPKYKILSYEINIWTQRQEEMNKIVSAIDSFNNRMWGESFKFRVSVGDFSFETLNTISERRIVRSNVTFEVRAALLEEYIGHEEQLTKAFSKKRIEWKNEREIDRIFIMEDQKSIRPSKTYIDNLRKGNDV